MCGVYTIGPQKNDELLIDIFLIRYVILVHTMKSMKLKYILILVAFTISSRSSAQLSSDNFFISFSSSLYLDIVKTPLGAVKTFVGTNPDGSKAYAYVPSQSTQFSSYSFGLEPRYNINKINDDAALAVSIPFSFGIGYANPSNIFVRGLTGIGSIQIPILVKLYYGNSSTYETEKDFGVSFGGGMEYNQVGLFGGSIDDKEDGVTGGFLLPVVTLGVHFWRGNSPFEVNLKYGTTKSETYRIDSNGQPLINDAGDPISRTAKGSSFKLSFLYLLNY
jgi:hypothetical protein